ncbi:MAG TPA: flagellar export chaperone FliS [Bryobacteraceae bacterium]|nr:flagellar export chaperone FliS [Bryobacteraceae bacterium]
MFTTAYQRYTENSLLSATPLEIVAAAYQAALEAVQKARRANEEADPEARGLAVNRALQILEELNACLDMTGGEAISVRLASLYEYMTCRLHEAHLEQSTAKLAEVERLLETLTSAWREIARHPTSVRSQEEPSAAVFGAPPASSPFSAEAVLA